MKKVLMFVYDSFAEFEISILVTCLSGTDYKLETFSTSDTPVTSGGKLNILPDLHIDHIKIEDYVALIIPGGEPSAHLSDFKLLDLLKQFHESKKVIAAICGGPALLGAAGILHDVSYTASITEQDLLYRDYMNWERKKDNLLVIDQNVITSTGSNYIVFAEEVLRKLGIVPIDEIKPLTYFRVPSSY
ncbi:DJ-1/PfpI family protein [Bacillus suaedaesalsae]|uniref:DJ-1/PfpI family protein n=1 Tax=Bacillus suaedaesalsae TaxID=2810349 RepID=A0ABS2DMF7_9BACI|nr:DJ-1/PfpI family protein [Bacillus suaedaesalsae]MBM6619591.1 DJ-1/PfpI family protein [Bacillus suaedaesalsae]